MSLELLMTGFIFIIWKVTIIIAFLFGTFVGWYLTQKGKGGVEYGIQEESSAES